MSDVAAIVRWYLALTVVAAAVLPIVGWLGAGLGPLRVGLVRPLSIVVLTAFVWWPAALFGLPFDTPVILVALVLVAVAGWGVWWWTGRPRFDVRWLMVSELVWLGLFVGYAWFRGFNPDIAYTEKPMEIAMLASASRSSEVPAPDPWLAGYGINYYYFGYQIIATLVRLSGVPAAIAFNLALATAFASVGTATMATAGHLARVARLRRGLVAAAAALGPLLVLIAGNLETISRLLVEGRTTIDAGWWQGIGWQASRVIVDHDVFQAGDARETINEFPAFSFVLGDLHPHVLTLPVLATVLALALSLLAPQIAASRARVAGVGALAGLLYASNSWDAPTGLALVILMLALASRGRPRQWLNRAGIAVAAALTAALPFAIDYAAPVGVPNDAIPGWLAELPVAGTILNTFGIVTWRPSSVGELLIVHGAWLAVFLVFAIVAAGRERALLAGIERYRFWLLGAGLLALGVAVAWAPAVLVIGLPLAAAAWVTLRTRDDVTRAVMALYGFGFVLVLVPEFLYIQDVFGDRMNTVFKLYFQAWLILGIASAAAIVVVASRASPPMRPALVTSLVIVIVATLPYAPLSADDWSAGFEDRRGLNGETYLGAAGNGDLAAIAWIREHARDGDTIAEAPGCSYGVLDGVPLNRVSAFTGVPTIVGWLGHESQWRRGELSDLGAFLDARVSAANATVAGERVDARPAPRFLILGQQELRGDEVCQVINQPPADVENRLAEAGWVVVFEAGGTRVFARSGDSTAAPAR